MRRTVPSLSAMAVEFPVVRNHPNRSLFEGTLAVLDTPSDRSPSGARGHRVVLAKRAVQDALPSLLGMALDFRPDWDGHDTRNKCGIITSARIAGRRLCVAGFLYTRDFPEVKTYLTRPESEEMGMSYELADAHVTDMRASVWVLNKVSFTGAAILLRKNAAYRNTAFKLKD